MCGQRVRTGGGFDSIRVVACAVLAARRDTDCGLCRVRLVVVRFLVISLFRCARFEPT